MNHFHVLLLLAAIHIVSSKTQGLRMKRSDDRRIKGRVLVRGDQPTTNIFKQHFEFEVNPLYAPDLSSGHIVKLRGLDKHWMNEKLIPALNKGKVELNLLGSIKGNELWVKSGINPHIYSPGVRKLTRTARAAQGTRLLLAIQVVSKDAITSKTLKQIRDDIFGSEGDAVNLVERYDKCSYGQLKIKRFHGKSKKGTVIFGGVTSIKIPIKVRNVDESVVRQAVITEATKQLGDLERQFHHVMLCLPPGTKGDWSAYGYKDHWLSVFNDLWCNAVSTQVHEVAHNLDLSHSGTATHQYGDKVGFMGFSYRNDDAPRMCFNAAKSWQLGWYENRQKALNPLVQSWNGKLLGIADYKKAKGDQLVILKLRNTGSEENYHIAFNRAYGINSGTQDAQNQVTIQRQAQSGQSTLVAKLGPGKTYVIKDYNKSGKNVAVRVNAINKFASPWYADVSVLVQRTSSVRRGPTNNINFNLQRFGQYRRRDYP